MDQGITDILSDLGLGICSSVMGSAIYSKLKSFNGTKEDFAKEIQDVINLNGANIKADTVISALAERGLLSIEGSRLHANDSLLFGSSGGDAVVGNNSALSTDKTSISMGVGAYMKTSGNATIKQNSDGSIEFST
jgi:hypothetical protein